MHEEIDRIASVELPALQQAFDNLLLLEDAHQQTQLLIHLANHTLGSVAAASSTYTSICLRLAQHYLRGEGLPTPDVNQALHWYNTARLRLHPVPDMQSMLQAQGCTASEQQALLQAIGFALRLEELREAGFEPYES